MYSFSALVSCSSNLLVTLRSAASTMPSFANMPSAVPACEMASRAYSTWYRRPSGEKIVVYIITTVNIIFGVWQRWLDTLLLNRIFVTCLRWRRGCEEGDGEGEADSNYGGLGSKVGVGVVVVVMK